MSIGRREFLAAGAAAVTAAGAASWTGAGAGASASAQEGKGTQMYGLIGKMIAVAGKRDELLALLLDGVDSMPGCASYVVAKDPANPDAIWITEVWDSKASHEESLTLESVKAAITKARPLIAGFGDNIVTEPVGGHGLVPTKAR